MKRFFPTLAACAVAAAIVPALQPRVRAQPRGEHWVGTWATAVVARPQPGAAPGGGAPQGFGGAPVAPQCFGQPPANTAATSTTTVSAVVTPTAPAPIPAAPGG